MRTWGGLDEVGLTKHPPFQLLLGARGLLPGEEGEARAELKVTGNTLPLVADVFGLPQKMVKGSLEPHLPYIHTSCLSLSKFLNPQFPQEIYCCVRGGCRNEIKRDA